MTDKLSVYNRALIHIGSTPLRRIDENVEVRRSLDAAWGSDKGGVQYVLEMGYWRFALRSVKLTYDNEYESDFGYRRRFRLADDFVKTYAVCEDEYFRAPLTEYDREGDFIYAEFDDLYLRYVSNATDRGFDLGRWPATFTRMVEYHLAREIAPPKLAKTKSENIETGFKEARLEARNVDCMEEPQKFPAVRGWAGSRRAAHRHENKRFGR